MQSLPEGKSRETNLGRGSAILTFQEKIPICRAILQGPGSADFHRAHLHLRNQKIMITKVSRLQSLDVSLQGWGKKKGAIHSQQHLKCPHHEWRLDFGKRCKTFIFQSQYLIRTLKNAEE